MCAQLRIILFFQLKSRLGCAIYSVPSEIYTVNTKIEMLFQMQIPEMFSYVGMKDIMLSTGWFFLFLKERVKMEHNLATQVL